MTPDTQQAAEATEAAWYKARQPRCGWCGKACEVDAVGVKVCPDHPMHDIQKVDVP